MDEIEYKLKSANPVLISHAISKLFDSIKKKRNDGANVNISQIAEFKLLSAKRDSADLVLSASACQALIALVENGLWDVGEALTSFVSSISSMKNFVVSATAIGRLLTLILKNNNENNAMYPFTLHAPQHPFIMILNQDKYSWQTVLNQMMYIMNHQNPGIKKNSIEMLRPVFLYILCNPSNTFDCCMQPVWKLLIKSDHGIYLQTEVLLWLHTADARSCVNTNYRILEFTEKALLEKNKGYCTAFAPIIASVSLQLLKHGSDPRPNFDILSVIIDQCDVNIGNLMLVLLAEIITLCPTSYLCSILQTCTTITKKMVCNDIFLSTLMASILKWLAYPSMLCSDALDIATNLIRNMFVRVKRTAYDDTVFTSKTFKTFSYFDPYVQFHVEIVRSLNVCNSNDILLWLKGMSQVPIDLKHKCKLLLSGLFLQTTHPEAAKLSCSILVDVCREIKSFESHLLSLLLCKLAKSKSTTELRYLLPVVPELVTMRENVPIVTHTLDSLLQGDSQLKYCAIELYLKTLKAQPRCCRFVLAAIIDLTKTDPSWYSNAICTRAMKYICENHPEHGETLVPLLSQILNRSTDINGGTASALAIKSISALCKASVIDISSTWRVLAPKMEKEKRAVVLESLCELFGDIISYPSSLAIEEHDQLITGIVSNLWKYAMCNDTRVIESALKSLCCYRLEHMSLETLPADFRSHLITQKTGPVTSTDVPTKPEDVFQYIPSTCWIEMLQKINKTALSVAGDLLISFVNEEVSNFRSGIYIWPHGEPENFKYLPKQSVIRGVGEYLRRSNKAESNNHRIITECLRIFAQRYPKPLPNVNWNILKDTAVLSPEAKKYAFSIACYNAQVSLSARSIIEDYLSTYKSETNPDVHLNNECFMLYSNLEDLCQVVEPNNIKPFLKTTLKYVLQKMNFNNEHFINLFGSIMSAYARTLRSQDMSDKNFTLLSILLEKLFYRVDLTCERFKPYITAVLELSTKHLEKVTSPRTWLEITINELKNAIVIRAEFIIKKCPESPLTWLNELIDETASIPSVQVYLLETIQRIHREMQFVKSITNWIVDFMTQIQGLLLESSQDNSNKVQFYCSVLFVSIISVSGIDCTLMKQDSLATSTNVRVELFPHAISILSDRQDWKHVIPQIMEWLNNMRTSTIPSMYKLIFHRSLISVRHNSYYKEVWSKYLSIKTEV
ncbi:PREDICTED: focadhesin [Dufourea novaeangliae]|uniref:Focadhesin n=1 Tax=Dufourea novaeangliae TaxID=178035 RepID=A0A154P5F4_DUFNO|nr:PREDICTED: focadhesin [Dufourea novaeangliae]KZC06418.1 Focadhesin [Dufourea novaeangliae]